MTSLACGLMPALQARRVNLVDSLFEDGIAPAGSTMRSRTERAWTMIMCGQVAVADYTDDRRAQFRGGSTAGPSCWLPGPP